MVGGATKVVLRCSKENPRKVKAQEGIERAVV
jgi:hypothetical protein